MINKLNDKIILNNNVCINNISVFSLNFKDRDIVKLNAYIKYYYIQLHVNILLFLSLA